MWNVGIENVENINMGPPNPGSSMGEKKFNKRIAQSDTEGAEVKKQKPADKKE